MAISAHPSNGANGMYLSTIHPPRSSRYPKLARLKSKTGFAFYWVSLHLCSCGINSLIEQCLTICVYAVSPRLSILNTGVLPCAPRPRFSAHTSCSEITLVEFYLVEQALCFKKFCDMLADNLVKFVDCRTRYAGKFRCLFSFNIHTKKAE